MSFCLSVCLSHETLRSGRGRNLSTQPIDPCCCRNQKFALHLQTQLHHLQLLLTLHIIFYVIPIIHAGINFKVAKMYVALFWFTIYKAISLEVQNRQCRSFGPFCSDLDLLDCPTDLFRSFKNIAQVEHKLTYWQQHVYKGDSTQKAYTSTDGGTLPCGQTVVYTSCADNMIYRKRRINSVAA